MNIFNKVTLHSLKKNKTRTVVTIIGIMLSAAMICAVTTFVSSMQNYVLNYAIYKDGSWHGMTADVTPEKYKDINGDKEISEATYNQTLGYASVESKNEYKPYLYVIGGDKEKFFDTLPVHLITGNYPKNQTEIIMPEHIRSNGGINYQIGDTITLSLGDRMLDGYLMGQSNPCYSYAPKTNDVIINDEIIKVKETRTYKIVGIYERPSFENTTAPGYTAITVADNTLNNNYKYDVYFKMKNVSEVYAYMSENELGDTQNTDVLMFMGVSKYDAFSTILISLAVIVIGLIMFGSISLIYNAFAISVSERTKQFGLLSSIGATKKQLKRMVLFEALAVSSIGIPLGIGVGISGIAVTLLLIGNRFSSMLNNYDAPLRICVSWESIIIATIIALITVLISAWIPSKRATKISAVEAIRQTADIKTKNKRVKTSKLTYKLFGLPGVIAKKHYKRNKRKYRATVISLFMSIVLFVSASAFTDYLIEGINIGFSTTDCDIYYSDYTNGNSGKSNDELLEILTADKNITEGVYIKEGIVEGFISDEYVTDEYTEFLVEKSSKENHQVMKGYLIFVNDEDFEKVCSENRLDKDIFYNDKNPLGIAFDSSVMFDNKKEKFSNLDIVKKDKFKAEYKMPKYIEGYNYIYEYLDDNDKLIAVYQNSDDMNDVLELDANDIYEYYTLNIEKTLKESPFYISDGIPGYIKYLYPISMMNYVLPKKETVTSAYYRFCFKSDDHASSFNNLKTALLENNLDPEGIIDAAANEEDNRNIVTIIQVFSYGFIILISLIAAANVFNTISTNISLRRREFAMLKSVGMTQKGFNKMMNFECLLYGSNALIVGLPVSAIITYLIFLAVSDGFDTTYHLPWDAIGISILSVFLVVFSTMLYSMSKIKKDNPVDALKNENL